MTGERLVQLQLGGIEDVIPRDRIDNHLGTGEVSAEVRLAGCHVARQIDDLILHGIGLTILQLLDIGLRNAQLPAAKVIYCGGIALTVERHRHHATLIFAGGKTTYDLVSAELGGIENVVWYEGGQLERGRNGIHREIQ